MTAPAPGFDWSSVLGPELCTSTRAKAGTMFLLQGKKGVILYFSAHWCPPCRAFTPQLAELYLNHLRPQGLEVVFVSMDQGEGQWREYCATMPWLSLPYGSALREGLGGKYGISGIPALVVLGPGGEVVTTDGRAMLQKDPTCSTFPEGWRAGPGGVLSSPGLVLVVAVAVYFLVRYLQTGNIMQ